MKFLSLIWILCLLVVVTSATIKNIDESVRIGIFTEIGEGVTIKANSIIGRFSNIGQNTLIEENSKVGDFTSIGNECIIKKNGNIQSFVRIGDRSMIGAESIMKSYSTTGEDVSIGYRVMINQFATTGTNAKLQDNSMADMYSNIGANAQLQSKAYLGKFSTIENHVVVNESAVIHQYVTIYENQTLENGEVVVLKPSSLEFYQFCTENVPDEQAEIAKPTADGSLSVEFNNLMRQLIDVEMNALISNCDRSGPQMTPKNLPQIVSLYLIQYHGLERFKEYIQKAKDGFNNEEDLRCKLSNEYHLGEQSEKNVLESDVKKTFILLLETNQDGNRSYRVEGDDFCKLFDQVRKEERKLSVSLRGLACRQ